MIINYVRKLFRNPLPTRGADGRFDSKRYTREREAISARLEATLRPIDRRRSRASKRGWDKRKVRERSNVAARLMQDPLVRVVAQSGKVAGFQPGHKKIMRETLFIKGHRNCCFCAKPLQISSPYFHNYATIEHKVPVALGGSDSEENLDLACEGCNSSKGRSLNRTIFNIRARLEALGCGNFNHSARAEDKCEGAA